jgi:hypothetical protein
VRLGRSQRGALIVVTALAVFLVATGNALADTRRVSDGNDRPGPLDIRSATHRHAGARIVHTISTFHSWPTGLLGRNNINLFALEISTDPDRALERVVLVFFANGRMVAGVFRPSGSFIGSATASRPNSRTVRVSLLRSRLGNPVGYRWNWISQYRAVGTCSRVCLDRAPNSGRVLHDITPPAIALTSFPAIATDTEYNVSFRVSDRGGAGLRHWQLQHRQLGTTGWTPMAAGTTSGLKSHHHVSSQGTDDQFRVVAADRHGNRRVSPITLVSVPFDDSELIYSGTWTPSGAPGVDFHGTLQESTDTATPATATYTFSGRYFAWVAPGGGTGVADVTHEFTESIMLSDFTGPRNIVLSHTFPDAGPHTVVITVISGTVPVDGVIVR